MSSGRAESVGRDSGNLYEVLDLPVPFTRAQQDALTAKDVKTAYRRALLRWHPDKLGGRDSHSSAVEDGKDSIHAANGKGRLAVDQITHAYEVLSDPKSRRAYDESLRADASSKPSGGFGRHRTTELDVIDLDDMSFDEQQGVWSKACRCGNVQGFRISEDELEGATDEQEGSQGEVLLACGDCSHHIKILFVIGDDDG